MLSCALAVAVLLATALGGTLLPRPDSPAPDPAPAPESEPDGDEKLAEFAARYRLTPRETEVMSALLSGNGGTQEIADRLFVSKRMVERYFSQIFEKTGVKNRVALVMRYHGDVR